MKYIELAAASHDAGRSKKMEKYWDFILDFTT